MSFIRIIRKRIYGWHRTISIIIAVPVLLWTVSGFLHPVMNHFKPAVSNRVAAQVLDTSLIKFSPSRALSENGIDSVRQFRTVKIYEKWFYQAETKGDKEPVYINAGTGNRLIKGDHHYAMQLAKQFVNEGRHEGHHHGLPAETMVTGNIAKEKKTEKRKPLHAELLTAFDKEYKASNRILPVYRISFEGSDQLRIYVDTRSDKMLLAIDRNRRLFNRFFSITHSWSFLDGMGKTKSALLGLFSALCFFSAATGLYISLISKRKKKTASGSSPKAKNLHRVLGNVFFVTTLLYAFSGAWHAFAKLPEKEKFRPLPQQAIATADIRNGIIELAAKEKNLSAVSLATIGNEIFWVKTIKGKKPETRYISDNGLQELKQGQLVHAETVANAILKKKDPLTARMIYAFDNEYSMMNKQLPVARLDYGEGRIYFIDAAGGRVVSTATSASKAERFSFRNLHMFHFWEEWLGKTAGKIFRDLFLVASTLGLLLAAFTGIMIWRQKRNRKRNPVIHKSII